MIIEGLCVVIRELVQFLFSWVNLPAMPESARTALDTYFGYIFDNLDFLNFFVNVSTLKSIAIVAVSLFIFVRVYKVIMWIINKIPLSIN